MKSCDKYKSMAAEKNQPRQTSQVGQDVVKTKQKEPEIQSKHQFVLTK